MTDVARVAGISTATVSNVLNHPEVVAAATRARVEAVIRDLGYVRDENAAVLRTGAFGRQTAGQRESAKPQRPRVAARRTSALNDAGPLGFHTVGGNLDAAGIRNNTGLDIGDRLSVILEGMIHSGVVDAVMPDGSALWMWCDGGLGRRLVFFGR